jgi:hypothetical protein
MARYRTGAARRKAEAAAEAAKWTRVLCGGCHKFFDTPKSCLECSNWNTCMECLRAESEEDRAVLRSRGIVI